MSLVSDEYGKRALDFVEDMQRLEAYDDILARIRAELEWFGLDFVTVSTIPGPGIKVADCMLMNTRPEDYSRHYVEKNYVDRDPIVLALSSFTGPFSWSDVRQQRLSKSGRMIIDEGRDFGALDGLIIPIATPNGSLSIFSPCGRQPNLTPRARSALDMIGIFSTQALQRATQRERRVSARIALTNREREVISWVAVGKSDDEIATILAISRTTAITHINNAKLKLNATRRAQAVMQALRYGEIHL